jgi:hypothetical protein
VAFPSLNFFFSKRFATRHLARTEYPRKVILQHNNWSSEGQADPSVVIVPAKLRHLLHDERMKSYIRREKHRVHVLQDYQRCNSRMARQEKCSPWGRRGFAFVLTVEPT